MCPGCFLILCQMIVPSGSVLSAHSTLTDSSCPGFQAMSSLPGWPEMLGIETGTFWEQRKCSYHWAMALPLLSNDLSYSVPPSPPCCCCLFICLHWVYKQQQERGEAALPSPSEQLPVQGGNWMNSSEEGRSYYLAKSPRFDWDSFPSQPFLLGLIFLEMFSSIVHPD